MPPRIASTAADKSLTDRVFPGSSELARLCRDKDWSTTPLGPIESWPPTLHATVSLIITSPIGMIVLWGPELVQIYNDGHCAVMGEKHPTGLGQPNRECWPEVRDFNAPIFEGVMERGESFRFENQSLVIERHGYPEEACFTLSFSPVLDVSGEVGGVLVTVVEAADAVLRERAEAAQRARSVTGSSAGPATTRSGIGTGKLAASIGAMRSKYCSAVVVSRWG